MNNIDWENKRPNIDLINKILQVDECFEITYDEQDYKLQDKIMSDLLSYDIQIVPQQICDLNYMLKQTSYYLTPAFKNAINHIKLNIQKKYYKALYKNKIKSEYKKRKQNPRNIEIIEKWKDVELKKLSEWERKINSHIQELERIKKDDLSSMVLQDYSDYIFDLEKFMLLIDKISPYGIIGKNKIQIKLEGEVVFKTSNNRLISKMMEVLKEDTINHVNENLNVKVDETKQSNQQRLGQTFKRTFANRVITYCEGSYEPSDQAFLIGYLLSLMGLELTEEQDNLLSKNNEGYKYNIVHRISTFLREN
ncbi:MAG: hypothetical protein COA97_02525 [Flavobacteriales bacterium]|nr:MAG: hypothetical protein COA97_02525 [Flavobacteriales bacterium]